MHRQYHKNTGNSNVSWCGKLYSRHLQRAQSYTQVQVIRLHYLDGQGSTRTRLALPLCVSICSPSDDSPREQAAPLKLELEVQTHEAYRYIAYISGQVCTQSCWHTATCARAALRRVPRWGKLHELYTQEEQNKVRA